MLELRAKEITVVKEIFLQIILHVNLAGGINFQTAAVDLLLCLRFSHTALILQILNNLFNGCVDIPVIDLII